MIKITNAITYEVRDDNGSHPVFITINGEGHSCHFTGSGDYGDYSHYWGSMGSGYKEFLIGLDYGYFFEKVTGYKIRHGLIIDVDKSKLKIKKSILSAYREKLINESLLIKEDRICIAYTEIRKEAKDLINAINNMEHCMSSEFDREIYNATESKLDLFWNYFDDGFSYAYQKDGQCEGFWKQFQKLCDSWREELKENK